MRFKAWIVEGRLGSKDYWMGWLSGLLIGAGIVLIILGD